jgi:hypothetical protein
MGNEEWGVGESGKKLTQAPFYRDFLLEML